ncbi:MAG: FAD-dependent oxidoreductase, partial [Calditrichia bacterium]
MKTNIVIIGAGISGLATAHFLKKQGLKPILVEKKDEPGGSIKSERVEGFLVEHGPNNALDTTPILGEMFEDLGIESEREFANDQSKNRYIVRDD